MLLGELIDECIYDVAFEAHRNIKQANSICQICQTRSVSLSIGMLPLPPQCTNPLFRCRSYGKRREREREDDDDDAMDEGC